MTIKVSISVNLNDKVFVKLTDEVKKILKLSNFPEVFLPKEDENGFSEWQLWALMEQFGKHCFLGCNIPFETTIYLNSTPSLDPTPPTDTK